jgi:hypothetical protein
MYKSNDQQISTSILPIGKYYRIVYTVMSMNSEGDCTSVEHSSSLIPSDVAPACSDSKYWSDALGRAERTAKDVAEFMVRHCGFVLNAKPEYSISDVIPNGKFKLRHSKGSVALTLNNGRRLAHSLRHDTLDSALAYFMIYVTETHRIPDNSVTAIVLRHALRSQLKAML